MYLLQANPQAQQLLVMSHDDFLRAVQDAVSAALNDKTKPEVIYFLKDRSILEVAVVKAFIESSIDADNFFQLSAENRGIVNKYLNAGANATNIKSNIDLVQFRMDKANEFMMRNAEIFLVDWRIVVQQQLSKIATTAEDIEAAYRRIASFSNAASGNTQNGSTTATANP